MNYRLDGYDINGQTIFIDTTKLKENIGEMKYSLTIDNKVHVFNITIADTINSETESSVVMIVKNEHFEINHQEKVDMEVLGKALFRAIKDFIDFKQEDEIQKMISKAIGNATKELSKDKIIEKIIYEGLLIIKDANNEEIIGTATSFEISGKSISLTGVDYKDVKDEVKIIKYEEEREVIMMCNVSEDYKIATVSDIIINKRSDDFEDIKQIADFNNNNEEFLIYRRGLLIKESSASDLIDEDEFEDMF